MSNADVAHEDPRLTRLMARGGVIALPLPAPDVWPHGPLPPGLKERVVGDDSLTANYCTLEGHRFLRAQLLLPITGARTIFGFEAWGSVSEESWQNWLAARARGDRFAGGIAWLANVLPGVQTDEPVPCNLLAGAPGALPRLQPQPGHPLAALQTDGIAPDRLRAIYAAAGLDFETTVPC